MQGQDKANRTGQRLALWIVCVALFWLGTTIAGGYLGWTSRTHAFFDLAALGGFAWALWMGFNIWRARRQDKG
ncbi:DUF5337 domain-containing protein [Pseudosulfitobacter koreensis]|uniref:DUF5337 domain-containing protein n=1 Tax=Pseudosulfitobacter koreensis TaxID=2968472 RepID=A0ABT1Z018_9RHOB|nr:DUF5337 domain-containing protein [Pseudosulfitobacter koreense]MCR8826462.1 DUF5337 domain-containing protein [Pseudosulfitobacter koreense]